MRKESVILVSPSDRLYHHWCHFKPIDYYIYHVQYIIVYFKNRLYVLNTILYTYLQSYLK